MIYGVSTRAREDENQGTNATTTTTTEEVLYYIRDNATTEQYTVWPVRVTGAEKTMTNMTNMTVAGTTESANVITGVPLSAVLPNYK